MSNIDKIETVDEPDSVNLSMSRAELRVNNTIEKGEASGNGILRRKQANSANNSSNQMVNGSNSELKNKRPKNTRLKQQQLPAWQPILTASTVLPLFFIIGCIFVAIGGVLLHYSETVNETVKDYTDCYSDADPKTKCSSLDYSNTSTTCTCTITFKLDKQYESPVYIYYGLKNFYQNHRRYVKSRDDNQLLGKTDTTLNTDCEPFDKLNGTAYAPCGAIANSLFNDTFTLIYNGDNNSTSNQVNLLRTGIAWTSDKNVKFANPNTWNNTVRPKNWRVDAQNLDPVDPSNTGYKNEDLIVWMRTAALPSFRKFHRRIDHSQANFTNGLPSGYYSVKINYNYPVSVFEGEKSFIITTTTWMGGKNRFLGIAYLVIGVLCILLGFIFLIIHLKYGKKINEEFNTLKTES